MDINSSTTIQLADKAFSWIQTNQSGINEALHDCLKKEDRNPTVQHLVEVVANRGRIMQGAVPYGVAQLKVHLMQEFGITVEQADAAVQRLKADERLYQVGRGLGKMLVVCSGPPKELPNNPSFGFPSTVSFSYGTTAPPNPPTITTAQNGPGIYASTDAFTKWITEPAVVIDDLDEQKFKLPASPRVAEYVSKLKAPPRKKVRGLQHPSAKGPVEIEVPAVVNYEDLQEIYDEFNALFVKLKAKCDELKEENMVLNQATWQT